MKKTITIIVALIVLLSALVSAQTVVVFHKKWYANALWYCGWETGTDETNLNATAPEQVWQTSTGALDSRETTNQLFGVGGYRVSGSSTSYVQEDMGTSYGTLGGRFRIKLSTCGITTSGDTITYLQVFDAPGTHSLVRLQYSTTAGPTYTMYGRHQKEDLSWTAIGSVTLPSCTGEYQIVWLYDPHTPKVGYKVYTAAGSLINSAEATADIYDVNAETFRTGISAVTTTGANVLDIDNFYVKEVTSYLYPE